MDTSERAGPDAHGGTGHDHSLAGPVKLDVCACWALLRSVEVGRLAVAIDARPEIFPVNYVVDHGAVVFRTAEGTKLAGCVLDAAVAFEIDGYDPGVGEAWSVVAKGRAREITQLHDLMDTVDLPLFPWAANPKNRFVRIVPDELTGRRFQVIGSAAWETTLRHVRRTPDE
jgi:nitroimidazol reductase NimA-like FMN-containing flavoprotein (pyridoxamine 5'-phosphate oxidase superfamily)